MTTEQKKWFIKYLLSFAVTTSITAMNLDGGKLLLTFLVVSIPATILALMLSKVAMVIRRTSVAILIPPIALGISAGILELIVK